MRMLWPDLSLYGKRLVEESGKRITRLPSKESDVGRHTIIFKEDVMMLCVCSKKST
jgi:hypothetical protein